jgi:hypothetical protein
VASKTSGMTSKLQGSKTFFSCTRRTKLRAHAIGLHLYFQQPPSPSPHAAQQAGRQPLCTDDLDPAPPAEETTGHPRVPLSS